MFLFPNFFLSRKFATGIFCLHSNHMTWSPKYWYKLNKASNFYKRSFGNDWATKDQVIFAFLPFLLRTCKCVNLYQFYQCTQHKSVQLWVPIYRRNHEISVFHSTLSIFRPYLQFIWIRVLFFATIKALYLALCEPMNSKFFRLNMYPFHCKIVDFFHFVLFRYFAVQFNRAVSYRIYYRFYFSFCLLDFCYCI